MSEEEFAHALNQIAPYTSLLHLHVLGEPLLHPLIGRFLDMCSKKRIRVHIVTNGTLLHNCIKDLYNKDALRSVSISLQSMFGATASFELFIEYTYQTCEYHEHSGQHHHSLLFDCGTREVKSEKLPLTMLSDK